MPGPPISFDDFLKVDLRVGRVVRAEPFAEARKPAYLLEVDFGPEIGTKRSSARITELYQPEELVGRLVVAVVNFPPKQIGPSLVGRTLGMGLITTLSGALAGLMQPLASVTVSVQLPARYCGLVEAIVSGLPVAVVKSGAVQV